MGLFIFSIQGHKEKKGNFLSLLYIDRFGAVPGARRPEGFSGAVDDLCFYCIQWKHKDLDREFGFVSGPEALS
jgi:hypothetical protein